MKIGDLHLMASSTMVFRVYLLPGINLQVCEVLGPISYIKRIWNIYLYSFLTRDGSPRVSVFLGLLEFLLFSSVCCYNLLVSAAITNNEKEDDFCT
jgi:hypothetical protein